MTLWNLLIIICLALLYVGLGLVFGQLRRLRDEIRIHFSTAEFPDPTVVPPAEPPPSQADSEPSQQLAAFSQEALQTIRQDLVNVQSRLLTAISAVPARLAPELEGLHRQLQGDVESLYRQMQHMERQLSRGGRVNGDAVVNNGGGDAEDRYAEARMLLVNGVDEDRVIQKTGLTVEEVSLLKKLSVDPERP